MPTETLYKPRGAGHGAPERDKRNYTKPRQKLADAFERWLDMVDMDPDKRFTRYADKLLFDMSRGGICYWSPNHIEMPSEEINSLVMCFDSHPSIKEAGIFVTALYNGLKNNDLVFDTDNLVIDWVGWGLQKGNRLTIKSDTGEETGRCNRGIIINHGKSRDLGKDTQSHIINHGEVYSFGGTERLKAEKRTGFLLNYGEADWMGSHASNVLVNYGKVNILSQNGLVQTFNFGEVKSMGEDSYGPLVNFGKCRTMGHRGSNRGFDVSMLVNDGECKYISSALPGPEIIIAARDPEEPHWMEARGTMFREEACREIPEIRKYLDGLKAMLGPHKHYTDVLAHLTGLDVKGDIKNILTKAGRLEG